MGGGEHLSSQSAGGARGTGGFARFAAPTTRCSTASSSCSCSWSQQVQRIRAKFRASYADVWDYMKPGLDPCVLRPASFFNSPMKTAHEQHRNRGNIHHRETIRSMLRSLHSVSHILPETIMEVAWRHGLPWEDPFPLQTGDCPLPCWLEWGLQ